MMGFRFQDPLWLLLLVPLLAMGWWHGRQRPAAVVYSNVDILKTLPRTTAQRVRRLLPWLTLLGLGLLTAALARPQQGSEEFLARAEGIAIEMCIDRSGSMQALDFEIKGEPVTRLTIVKKMFRQFVDGGDGLNGRRDDLVGLVDFGGFAEAKCPLTLDHGALEQLLETVNVAQPMIDAQGNMINRNLLQEDQSTAIGDGLALAVDRLKTVKAKSKIIILLSDGASNSGVMSPEEAANIAKTFGIKVYTIGIGTTTGTAPVRGTDAFGNPVMMQIQADLDEKTLTMIAEMTGGQYFNAQDSRSLKQIYATIDKLEKTASESRRYTQYGELFEYPLVPGLLLLLGQVVLVCTRFRTLP
jgi:Ca-activated chloride channel family protein